MKRMLFLTISLLLLGGIIGITSCRSFALRGELIANFGASIYGNTKNPTSISSFLTYQTGAATLNLGFGGARMSATEKNTREAFSMVRIAEAVVSGDYTYQKNAICLDRQNSRSYLHSYYKKTIEQMEQIDFDRVSIATIGYGSNDFTAKLPIDNEADPYDTQSFMGAVRYSVNILHKRFPHLKIYICAPSYRFWREKGRIVMDSEDCDAIYGNRLSEYRDAENKWVLDMQSKGENWLYMVDLYSYGGLNRENCEHYYGNKDGTHPNALGRWRLAKEIARELLSK